MSELFTRPRFYRNVEFESETDRSVSWLELFYDLVYVATLIQIGNFLSDNVSLLGFAQYFVMLLVVWWAWTGETFYQNRYVVDDWLHRVLVFTQMFGVALMGLSVSAAFGDLYVQFTLAYVVTRLMLVLMYVRTIYTHPESADLSRGYIAGFSLGIVIWLGSLLLPPTYHWVGWLLGIAVELATPLLPQMRTKQIYWMPDIHHISERFGIFTIIVLGEAFVKVLDDAQGTAVGMNEIIFSTFGLLVLYSLWWLYFSDTAGKLIDFSGSGKAVIWIYTHMPLAASLVAFGVAAKKAFGATVDYSSEALYEPYRLLYTGAIVMYLVALGLIDFGLDDEETAKPQVTEATAHFIGAVMVAIVGLTFTDLTPNQFVMLIALIMLSQVGFSIYQTNKHEHEDGTTHMHTHATTD